MKLPLIRRSRRGKFDGVVLVVFVLAIVVEGIVLGLELSPVRMLVSDAPHVAIGNPAPMGFSLRNKETSEQINLLDKRDQVVLLVFWGHWDVPSRQMLPELNRLYEERLKNDPRCVVLPVVCEFPQIPVGSDMGMEPNTKEIYEAGKITLPVFYDETGDARRSFSVEPNDYPMTLLIDAEGIVRGIWAEYGEGLIQKKVAPELEKWLRQAPARRKP